MVWNRRQEKYRTVEIMASTTARRITARRICNKGVGLSDLILMGETGTAARAALAPDCASKFASLPHAWRLRVKGRSLRVTGLRKEGLSTGVTALGVVQQL